MYLDNKSSNSKFTCYGSSLTGSTGINGDAFYISFDKRVFLLADGASGAGKEGKVLMSATCVDTAKGFEYATSGLNSKAYIDTLFHKINQRLINLSHQNKTVVSGTIIIAVINNNTVTVTTYGDSPAYLYKDNTIIRVAKNKKRYENLIGQGFITKEQYDGYTKQMHERMQSCFDLFLPAIAPNNEIAEYTVSAGDMFFICSDGLSNWVPAGEVFENVSKIGVQQAVDKSILKARDLSLKSINKFDDITAVTICWNK